MCTPFIQTHAPPQHTDMGPDLHPTMLASAGEGADGVAGLGAGPTPRGSGFAPLMFKNQSRMNHHKERVWGEERKEKGEGGGEDMGSDGNPRGYRGQRKDAGY